MLKLIWKKKIHYELYTNINEIFYLQRFYITISRPNAISPWVVTDVAFDEYSSPYNTDGYLPVIKGYIPTIIYNYSTVNTSSLGTPQILLKSAHVHNYLAVTKASRKFGIEIQVEPKDMNEDIPGQYSWKLNTIEVLYIKYDLTYYPYTKPPYTYGDIEWDK